MGDYMDRAEFDRIKQMENEILRGRPVGSVTNGGYGKQNGLTPEQTIGFINKQSANDAEWKAVKAFYNGSWNMLERGVLGSLAMLRDNNIESLKAQGIEVGDGGKYIDMALNSDHLQPYEVKGNTQLGQLGLDLAQGAGQLASQAALAVTTGGIGSTLAMGASIAGNQYADLRREGVPVDRATRASVMNAGIQAPLEKLSIGNILSKLPAGSGLRQKVVQIAQNAITEGVTEYVQQYPEEIANIYAKNGGNIEELVNKTLEQLPEIHRNGLYAGMIGVILGGGAGAINVAVRRNVNAAQLEAVEGRVEQAKQIGITPEAYANTVNNNLPDSNVSVDGDVLLKFMQSGKTEEIAQSLGVTVNEVQQAADEGLTVEIRQGNYEGTAMKYADFMPAVRDYSAFEVNGFMQSDTQGQKELQKEYQQFTDNEEEFQGYKDEKIAEMQAAGIKQQEALNAMILLESRARVYNPDNPLAFFEAYPIEFRRGENNKDGYNQSATYFNDFSEHRGQGYSGYSKSNNAIEAESEGRYPASVAAKKLGVKPGAIKLYIDTDEWHHTSSMYNRTPYYDIRYLLEYKEGGKEALQAEGLEESEITDIEKLYEQLKNYKEPKKDEQVYKADVEYIVWSGTKSRPKANVKTYKNIEVREKGSFYTFVLPDGSTVRKKISSNGTNVTRIYTAEEKAERARRAEEVRRQNMLESALNNEKQDAELLEHIQLGEETKRWLNENADKTEGSNSGNLYAEGRKPSRADYDKGLDKFFKKGERRLSPMGKAVVLEEWDGKKWQTIEKSLPLDVSDDYESSVVYFAANAYERNKFLNNERAHAEKSANIYNQSAYHGTPHSFERFDLGAIGTGEGAQAHGWGLYFAADRKIADEYRNRLSDNVKDITIGNKKYKQLQSSGIVDENGNEPEDVEYMAAYYLGVYGNKNEALKNIEKEIENPEEYFDDYDRSVLKKAKELLENNETEVSKSEGIVFEVDVPENDVLLNENKTLDEQPENVKNTLRKMAENQVRDMNGYYNQFADAVLIADPKEVNGRDIYRYLVNVTGNARAASIMLNENGIKGITYYGGTDGRCFVVFDDKAISIINRYNQSANEGNRGSIRWESDGTAIVELFSVADASTFIHESIGHYFANVLAKEAVLPGANEQTVKDFETMLDYAGTTRERWEYLNSKPRPALTEQEDAELVKIQETWATAAEQYILEGKAPNRELQPVFNRFKKWLINVYKTIESFVKNNQYAVPITDEVRQVFDRMLASEQQISEMEKLNGYYAKLPKAITDNLSDAYKTRLYDAMAKAHDKAVQLLTRKSLENFTAERKEQIAEYRADMRPKVAAQVDNEPLYRAEKEAADMITSGGKQPKTIARRYIDSNAQEYKDWKSELDRVQSDINSRLDPIIQALEAGMGNGVAKVRDDATGRYIRISNNDPWYSDFYRTYKRRPTKAELRDMAYKIYVGEGYNLLPDSVARNAEEEAAYAELKEDIDGLMEYEEELLSYKGEMEQYKGKGLSDEDAYTFDMLAEEYGFSSGDDLAKAILESPTRQQAIKQRLDDEVQKKFPDIYKERRLAEAATQEAFYNDDTGAVLGLEEQIIEDAAKRTLDQQRNAEQQRQLAQMKRQQAKVQAQGYLRSVPLREALRIQKYITAERRAAANAATALAKGDYETALDYKHKQLLNHAMAQESINMNRRYTQYGKFLNRQRKLKKESWNNEENFMQVGALFARMGLRLRGYDARLKQQSLKEWADAMQADYDNVAIPDWVYDESRTFTRPLSDLTFDEYEDVVNALKNIKAVVKAQTMMEGEAKAKTFAETKAEGMAVLEKKPTKYTPDVNEKGKASAFAKFKRQLRNSDNFFEMIDGWTYGWYSKFFGETVRKAADVEAELTMQYEDATRQAYKEWLPDKAARKAASVKVKYDELGTSATKHTLIYLALNLGNESNAAKLCSTAVNSTFRESFQQSQLWVDGDAIQTKKNLLEFLGKNLTAADWRYVQKKIDIANMFWTQMSELERRDKGFAPPKVEAYPEIITLADGQQIVYRGGYFPLIRRRDTGSHPASQDAIPATTGGRPGDSIRTLHTNTGHTKARDNSVYPIDLTGGGEYAVAMDTIHDIAFREPMNNFRKLMNDREFYNMLKSKLGIADMEALEEFLKKAAQLYGGSGFATLSERDTGKFMSWLRNKTVNAAIMLNFKTSLQNLGNPLLYGRVVDGFDYADVLVAYANYQKNWQGRKGFHAMRDFVYGKSVFMRERGQLPDISLRDMKDEGAELNPIEKRTIKWGTQMLTFTDNLSALPVWLQAYQKKINAKASEQEAIQFADTVIRRTLGSSRITDVAPIQRGGPLMKLLTTFQGFFNTQYNQWNREFNIVTRLIKEGSYGTAAGRVTAFAASKFLLFNLLNLALALENPFDDDDDDGWPKIATELLHYPISLLGPVGGIANATLNNMLGIRDYGYNMTAIEGSLDKLFKAGKLVGDIADGDKDVEEAVEPVAGVATMAAGIPNQLNKLFFNAWDILYNDMDAEWRDLFYRRPSRDR